MKFPLLPRNKNTNKKDYGHVLILAGSANMTGAAILTANACVVSGSGLTTLAIPRALQPAVAKNLIEVMTLPLSKNAFSDIRQFIQKRRISAVAMGPGLSMQPQVGKLVRQLLCQLPVPMVLDADALNHFAGHLALLKKRRAPVILTPHAGEFQRLFKQKLPEPAARRMALAKKIAAFYDVVLVLKGPRTLVVSRSESAVNRSGNPALAKGGSGDVLTGMIAAFLAQKLSPFEAAKWAVYAHGRAGDLAAKDLSQLSVRARDLIEYLPKVFKRL